MRKPAERKDLPGPEANEALKIVFTHAGGGLPNDEPAPEEEQKEGGE